MEEFKHNFSREHRQKESQKLKDKHEGHFPIFVYKQPNSDAPETKKNKFLVAGDRQMGAFINIVKKQHFVKTDEDHSIKAMFFFVKNTIVNPGRTVGELYEDYKDEDGFLYIEYSTENTFGGGITNS